MGKTLYLTDLDGTFLSPNARISERSERILRALLQHGVLFSVATARTYATVMPMFAGLSLTCPLVLMNGVCIYDPVQKKTLQHHRLKKTDGQEIERIFLKHSKYPMLYYENHSKLRVEYKQLVNEPQRAYVSARDGFFNKGFVQVDAYGRGENGDLIYCVTLDKKQELDAIYKEVSALQGMHWKYYPDNYTDCYFLEGMQAGVSKASGALEVKALTGADKIVAFGDNRNDLELFEIADEAYAVSNACEALKRAATGVIDSNENDAVALFLLSRFERGIINQ